MLQSSKLAAKILSRNNICKLLLRFNSTSKSKPPEGPTLPPKSPSGAKKPDDIGNLKVSSPVKDLVNKNECSESATKEDKAVKKERPQEINPNVPGLSKNVLELAKEPVGPGIAPDKSGPYKVPEYYCYNNTSYFEAEIEIAKYRLKQPSSRKEN